VDRWHQLSLLEAMSLLTNLPTLLLVKSGVMMWSRSRPEFYSKISRNASAIFVFRVIGLPGDTIDFDSKNNYAADGEPIELALRGDRVFERQAADWYEISAGGSRAISRGLSLAIPVKFPVKISVDQFFVSGDNRANALDSRYWGTVTFELVRGRVRID